MQVELIVDGNNFTQYVEDLQDVKLTVGLDSKKQIVEQSTTNTLTLTGEGAKYFASFVTGCSNLETEIPAQLRVNVPKCGWVTIDLGINARSTRYCPNECKAYINLVTIDEDSKVKEKLERTLWHENGFADLKAPKVFYSDQPNSVIFISVLLIRQILALVLYPLYIAYQVIATAISILCNAFNQIPLIPNINCPTPDDLNPIDDFFEILDRFNTGTGRYGHCPLLRDIFEYQAKQCGLTFKSSPLQSLNPRYNSCVFCLDNTHGYGCDEDRNINVDNQPLDTVMELMEDFAATINGQVRILDGCIYIERKDFFDRFNQQITDLVVNGEKGLYDDEICYQYDTDELCATEKFQWCNDAIETQGNRVMRFYRKYMNYGSSTSNQKGECETTIPFAPSRFMYDQESFERDGFFDFDAMIDDFRDGGFGLFGNQGKIRSDDLILSGGSMAKCKLLALEMGFDYDDAKVIKRKIGERDLGNITTGIKSFYEYNYPYYMDALCQDFFFLNDPNNGNKFLLKSDSVTFPLTCTALNTIIAKDVQAAIKTHVGTGLADSYEICFKECYIKASNVRIKC